MPAAEYTKTVNGLVPTDDEAIKIVGRCKVGERIYLNRPSQRSARQDRYYHALCQVVFDNSEQFASVEEVKDSAKLACGHTRTTHIKHEGTWYERKAPRSITELDHDGFNQFVQRVLDYFAIELGIDDALLALETRHYT